jgi:ribosomal protein L37AE/L43A
MSNQQLQSLSFGAIDRPACPHCGKQAYLTRRSPHPDHDLRYELQIFTCSACDRTIERIVDGDGNPPEKLKCCD